ncbi:MAG: hypothetical protein NTY86_03220 [Deltaproteobacteria bacterium]|nr:hypothetical protein [Deltaproteobacteria bacterium]
MSPQSKKEYRETVHLRYKNAPHHEKTAILDEFCATCGCHRKHAIRVLKRFKRFTKPKAMKRGKPPIYQSQAPFLRKQIPIKTSQWDESIELIRTSFFTVGVYEEGFCVSIEF